VGCDYDDITSVFLHCFRETKNLWSTSHREAIPALVLIRSVWCPVRGFCLFSITGWPSLNFYFAEWKEPDYYLISTECLLSLIHFYSSTLIVG